MYAEPIAPFLLSDLMKTGAQKNLKRKADSKLLFPLSFELFLFVSGFMVLCLLSPLGFFMPLVDAGETQIQRDPQR